MERGLKIDCPIWEKPVETWLCPLLIRRTGQKGFASLFHYERVRPELPNGRSDDPFLAAPPGPTVPFAEFRCFHGLRWLLPNPFCGGAFVAAPPGRLRSRR